MMRFSVISTALCCLVAVSFADTEAQAASKTKTETVMTVSEMCGGCVKRITAKLEPLDGVKDVRCDIKQNTVTVYPETRKTLSPKFLWEQMESIGKTPKKLVGPTGTYTKKPKA